MTGTRSRGVTSFGNIFVKKKTEAKKKALFFLQTAIIEQHSALRRNLMKVWKTWTGLSLGGRAWSRGPKSALSKILQNKEHFY